ncbi:hypothetical protein DPMN_044072 [Dreissena polymorpha]|uniref:Uncharacterized protein n=1 Tax=Dreissena polymorpha TaxID=45954 RepID=A0A9D4D3W2_DREPO|nr:hypothetical protein DPMN_044072 [Dreissena polymorpha]
MIHEKFHPSRLDNTCGKKSINKKTALPSCGHVFFLTNWNHLTNFVTTFHEVFTSGHVLTNVPTMKTAPHHGGHVFFDKPKPCFVSSKKSEHIIKLRTGYYKSSP